jgi:hypothetical protein
MTFRVSGVETHGRAYSVLEYVATPGEQGQPARSITTRTRMSFFIREGDPPFNLEVRRPGDARHVRPKPEGLPTPFVETTSQSIARSISHPHPSRLEYFFAEFESSF